MTRDCIDADAILREHVRVLKDEVRGSMREDRTLKAVDEAMRVLAVTLGDPDEAAERLIAAVRGSIAGEALDPSDAEDRLRFVEAAAGELFARHRGRLAAIREGELRRSSFVAGRAAARRSAGAR